MKNKDKLWIPLIAITLGLLLGIIILLMSNKDVFALFSSLLKGLTGIDLLNNRPINLRYPGEFIVTLLPITLTGLSIGFAYRTGLFNIGAEGQVIVGSLIAIIVSILVPMPNIIGQITVLVCGGLAGALYALLPGYLKTKFNISEVVTGIMMNYTALYSANYFIKALPGSTETRTVDIPESVSLQTEFLRSISNNSRLNYGIIVLIIALFLYWFIIEKTTFGYGLRATGLNKEGARYAGIKVDKNIVYSMMISGLFSGLAGAIIIQGTFGYGRVMSSMDNYGFDGIAVALVGAGNALGILFSGMLFALLGVSQTIMQTVGIPKDIGEIISSSIVFFVAIQYAIKLLLNKIRTKKQKEVK